MPALAFVLWPVLRRRDGTSGVPASSGGDRRLELLEERTAAYRALKELAFDHEAGHLSDDDYEALRARYEERAADVLAALDALPPPTPAPAAPSAERAARRGWTRHPATLPAAAVLLVVFGVVIGLGVTRFSQPEAPMTAAVPGGVMPGGPMTGVPMPPGGPGTTPGPAGAGEPARPIPPQVMAGMLNAARESLYAGRYQEAIAAYQAVLKRDPRNVDAMTHLGAIVAIGGHADVAIETFDKAIAIDPSYAPAHLYRGQVLYEVKQDYAGAVTSWERFLKLVPQGEDHDRISKLVKEARAKQTGR
jgi:tetratricopeptide (TPR) repeat protein